VFLFAEIEPEYLFFDIVFQVKRLYGDVRSAEATLEARSEILDSIHVDVAPNIALDVVDDSMRIVCFP
jgi:hypothetical protein